LFKQPGYDRSGTGATKDAATVLKPSLKSPGKSNDPEAAMPKAASTSLRYANK